MPEYEDYFPLMANVSGFDVAELIHDCGDEPDTCAADCPGCELLRDLATWITENPGGDPVEFFGEGW